MGVRNYLQHGRRHGVGGTDTYGGGFIAFDVENLDPEGSGGELLIDTGFIEIGNQVAADWEVTAIDVQWNTTGTSGFDFEADGGDVQVTANKTGGGAHGAIVLTGDDHVTVTSHTFTLAVSATGGISMTGLPTSNPGGSGKLWNNGGVLNIT